LQSLGRPNLLDAVLEEREGDAQLGDPPVDYDRVQGVPHAKLSGVATSSKRNRGLAAPSIPATMGSEQELLQIVR